MHVRISKALLGLAVFLSPWFGARAQELADLSPTRIVVKDPSGAAIPGAVIEIAPLPNIATKNLRTDMEGLLFILIPPGSYDLAVSSSGFRTENKRIQAVGGDRLTIEIVLNVGSCSGGCEAYSLRSPLFDTASPSAVPPSPPVFPLPFLPFRPPCVFPENSGRKRRHPKVEPHSTCQPICREKYSIRTS
jgi:hypothetical protein